ncbi:hypothetical protein LTR27_005720 [Elasticomyces elasticus]|nr:hypothetical protein LTR27_005720 [Elasticomyces elasticus]
MAPGVQSFDDYPYGERNAKLTEPLKLTRPAPRPMAPANAAVTTPARSPTLTRRPPLTDITNRPATPIKLPATSTALEKAGRTPLPTRKQPARTNKQPARTNKRASTPTRQDAYAVPADTSAGFRHRSPSPVRPPAKKQKRYGDSVASAQPYGFRTDSPDGTQARMLGTVDGDLKPPIWEEYDKYADEEYMRDEGDEAGV